MRKFFKYAFYTICWIATIIGAGMALGNEGFYREVGIAISCFFLALFLIEYTKLDQS